MDAVQQQVTETIRTAMAVRGITQRELGNAIGLKHTAMTSRFTGRANWTLGELVRAGDVLGVPGWLILRGRQHVLQELAAAG